VAVQRRRIVWTPRVDIPRAKPWACAGGVVEKSLRKAACGLRWWGYWCLLGWALASCRRYCGCLEWSLGWPARTSWCGRRLVGGDGAGDASGSTAC